MMARWTGRIVAIAVVVAIVGAAVFWWNRPKPAPAATAPPTPQVGVVEVKAADVALPLDFSGRVAGFRVVEIRAQVSGVLLKREYQEGAVVDVGQVLFRIDPRTYEAALARANAQAAQARATADPGRGEFQTPGGPGGAEGRHAKGLRGRGRRPRPGARGRAVDRGRRADGQAQHRIHHHQGAGEGADQPGVAGRGHADPGAADPAHHHHPARSGLRQLHLHRLRAAPAAGDRQVAGGAVRFQERQGRAAVRRRRGLPADRHGRHALAHRRSAHRHHPDARHLPQP